MTNPCFSRYSNASTVFNRCVCEALCGVNSPTRPVEDEREGITWCIVLEELYSDSNGVVGSKYSIKSAVNSKPHTLAYLRIFCNSRESSSSRQMMKSLRACCGEDVCGWDVCVSCVW